MKLWIKLMDRGVCFLNNVLATEYSRARRVSVSRFFLLVFLAGSPLNIFHQNMNWRHVYVLTAPSVFAMKNCSTGS